MHTQTSAQLAFSRRLIAATGVLVFLALPVQAIPLSEYHRHIKQAVTALDTLAQSDETEDATAYAGREAQTIESVRQVLPKTERVDWSGTEVSVDNSWLHQELDKYRNLTALERIASMDRIKQRLQAIDERINEIEMPANAPATNKAENQRRLQEILARSEYARQIKQESAITRLLREFAKWIENLFPKPKGMSPGTANWFSAIAQIVVFVVAIGVIVFVIRLFLPRLLRSRGRKKEAKAKARIVMGERIAPDKTAVDLLAEAEALARSGELRAAIRKAYIALLVEMGDRKIISLAQYKTNRDYLRAVRNVEHLYVNVKELTDSFERHWYGLATATENDWLAFRATYNQALSK